jgi:hypothetical protein
MTHEDKNPRALYEALQEEAPIAGQAIPLADMLGVLRHDEPGDVIVKALVFRPGAAFPDVYDVKDQFMFRPGNDWTGFEILRDDGAERQETTVQQWLDDLGAIDRDRGDGDVSVYMLADGENGQKSRFSLIFDDQTNVMFAVKDLAGTGHDWADVRRFVSDLAEAATT